MHIEGTEWSHEWGPADHDWDHVKEDMLDHGFKDHWHGQPVICEYRVGGGGGHSLHVEDMKCSVKFERKEVHVETATEEVNIPELDADDADDEWHEMFVMPF